MICPVCNTVNRNTAKFCDECGARLPVCADQAQERERAEDSLASTAGASDEAAQDQDQPLADHGKDAALEGVDAISGATITSNAYERCVQDCFAAYDAVKEG